MSDEEVERFEITDYDLETEFNPGKFRKKQSKHSATYGVFAPDSDDDDGGGGGRPGFGRRGKERSSGYSSGVAFVSAGIQKPVEFTSTQKPAEKPAVNVEEKGQNEPSVKSSDSSSEEEFQVIPKSFGGRGRGMQDFGEIAGLRKQNSSGRGKTGAYGIGEKLALKMGYQPGKGLGKELQGIAAPIEAVVRKGRGAIGLYGKEAKVQPSETPFAAPDKPAVAKNTAREQKWQKFKDVDAASTSKKKKDTVEYRYMSADEVLESRQLHVRPDAGHLAKTKVIDMTGTETRILSGYHAISGQRRPDDQWDESRRNEKLRQQKSAFDMPELIHNVNLLLDSCEQDILKNDKKTKYASDRQVTIKQETSRLARIIEQENTGIENLEVLMREIKCLCATEKSADLQTLFIALGRLQRDYEDYWEMDQLYTLVPALIVPKLKNQLINVNLLSSSREVYNLFSDWRNLLSTHHETFDTVMWEAWMPTFRQAFGYWNVKDADSMLNVIENWKPLLPGWIFQNILEQMILPKINEGVEAWDPLSDNIPIHAWIHPWLPILGARLEIVYPTIRRKLANALVHWHPSDVSGKQILTPWVSVFSPGAMDTFLLKNIMPKLQVALQQLVINPSQQVLDPWKWVMEWQDLIPTKAMVTLLESFFFPKWHQFLIGWLNQRPNFEQVFHWYTWWRNVIPELFMRDPVVTDNIQKALQMINAAIQAPGQVIDYNFILSSSQPMAGIPPQPQPIGGQQALADALRMTAQVPNGFRDLVQMKCEELGLLFLPIPNRYYEGKQVYKCGNALIYISANVIYVNKDGLWTPTSLHQMINYAAS